MIGVMPVREDTPKLPPSAISGYREKVVICKPGRGSSIRTRLAGNLVLDFPPSGTMRNKCLVAEATPCTVFCYSSL